MDALAKVSSKDNFFMLVNELGITGTRSTGASFIVKKISQLSDNAIDRIKGFEFIDESASLQGLERRYDMVLTDGTRIECKSWKEFYASSFEKQFLNKDLVINSDLNNIRYIVDESKMSLEQWKTAVRDFLIKKADVIINDANPNTINLFRKLLNPKAPSTVLINVDEFSNYIKTNDNWFNAIFKQEI